MLTSLQIRNFRCFRDLRIDRTGHVNLVVGQNGVGKTSLLEAIRLFASDNEIDVLTAILFDRDEIISELSEADLDLPNLDAVFYDRDSAAAITSHLEIRSDNDERKLTIRPLYVRRTDLDDDTEGSSSYGWRYDEVALADLGNNVDLIGLAKRNIWLALSVARGSDNQIVGAEEWRHIARLRAKDSTNGGEPTFVPARGISSEAMDRWWDAIALSESEERIYELLKFFAPIERVTFIKSGGASQGVRVPVAKVTGRATPVPLRSLGGGIVHLFQIALAIEHSGMSSRFGIPRARNDRASRFLLVDEIENGVHYTRHIEMWRSIFKIARLLGVQVFASTHSWDCIEGFQAVASEDSACEGALIRLEKSADSIRAVTFSEDELSIATRDNIEVR